MKTIDFNNQLPSWAHKILGKFSVKSPSELYGIETGKESYPYLNLNCSDNCGAKMNMAYYGLNSHLPGEYLYDVSLQFNPDYPKDKDKDSANNITVDASSDEVINSIRNFLDNLQKAIAFKKELSGRIKFLLEFWCEQKYNVEIIIRQDEDKIAFLLRELSERLHNVPILSEAKTYHDCLGIIHTLEANSDISSIKAGDGNTNNPLLDGAYHWINILLKTNGISRSVTHKSNLWVRAY